MHTPFSPMPHPPVKSPAALILGFTVEPRKTVVPGRRCKSIVGQKSPTLAHFFYKCTSYRPRYDEHFDFHR